MQVAKLMLEKGVNANLSSVGEVLHRAHVLFYVPAQPEKSQCCPEEQYRRIAVESSIRPLTAFLSVKSSDKYKKCKREYIQYGDKLLDPLVPRIEQSTFEDQYKAVLSYISHIPLLTLPGDEILMSFYSRQPFTVKVRVDW